MDQADHDSIKPDDESAKIQDAAGKVVDSAREELNDISADFDSRLRELSGRSVGARQKYEAKKAKAAKEQKSTGEASKGLGVGLTIAYAILGTPLVGYGVGYLIDSAVGGKAWQGWLTILGAFAGMAFAIITLQRQEK